MKWTPIQSQNCLRAWMISLRSFMRAVLLSVFCSAWLSLCSFSRADDRLSVEDLSAEEFEELAALSVGLKAAAASSSGNITNDVAAILDLLNGARFSSSGRLITVPYVSGSSSKTLGEYLVNGLGDGWTTGSSPRSNSFLYQIRELLKTFPTNYPVSDLSWTNSILSSISDFRSDQYTQIASILQYLSTQQDAQSYLAQYLSSLTYTVDSLASFFSGPYMDTFAWSSNYLSSFEYAPGLWHSHIDDSQFSSLLNAVSSLAQNSNTNVWAIGDFQSAVGDDFSRVVDILNDIYFEELDIENSAWNIEDYARAIHYDDLDYDGSGRSVQSDFRFLQQQLGVEIPSPSNNLYSALVGTPLQQLHWASQLHSASNSFQAESARSENSASNEFSRVESDIASVTATNNLDYEQHWYNQTSPVDELSGLGSSALAQFENAMPSMPDATDWTITLFNGNFPVYGVDSSPSRSAGSLSLRSVPLNISYALRDNDAVSGGLSTMNGIMEVIWDLCELVLVLWMYKRFYDDVVSGNFERM